MGHRIIPVGNLMRTHFHSATVSEFSLRQFRRRLWRTCIRRIFATESSRLQIYDYDWIAIMRMTQSIDPKSKHYKRNLKSVTHSRKTLLRETHCLGNFWRMQKLKWDKVISLYYMMLIFPSVMEVRQALFKEKYSELACSILLLKAFTIVYSIYIWLCAFAVCVKLKC